MPKKRWGGDDGYSEVLYVNDFVYFLILTYLFSINLKAQKGIAEGIELTREKLVRT